VSEHTPETQATEGSKPSKKSVAPIGVSTPLALPSGTVVTYREPIGQDRRDLIEGFDGEILSKTGQTDSALAFNCLLTKDNKDLADLTWQKRQDIFDYKDAQFYEETFVRAVMLTEEEFAEAQKVAKQLTETGSTKLTLLSGRKVGFRAPRNWDRRDLLSGPDGQEMLRKQGKLEESLALVCLEKFGEVELSVDLTQFAWNKRLDKLTIKEAQFYQAVFMSMFFLNRSDMQQINQQAKKAFGSSTVTH